MEQSAENKYFDIVINQKMYSTKSNLKFRLDYIFKDVELADKNVLDVGGGSGLLSFYTAVNGAKKVICLEPEFDGSSSGMIKQFNEVKSELSSELPISLIPETLQSYLKQAVDRFDVVILHNSINHLDEEACINFLNNKTSYNKYKQIFDSLYQIMNLNSKLIVADCSSENFYNTIGVKCYFNPTIEWHKHQKPSSWINMLEEVGFKNPKVSWSTPNKFRNIGRMLMGNSLMSYFTQSHFKFVMEK